MTRPTGRISVWRGCCLQTVNNDSIERYQKYPFVTTAKPNRVFTRLLEYSYLRLNTVSFTTFVSTKVEQKQPAEKIVAAVVAIRLKPLNSSTTGGFKQQWFLYACSAFLDSSEIFIMPAVWGTYILSEALFLLQPPDCESVGLSGSDEDPKEWNREKVAPSH